METLQRSQRRSRELVERVWNVGAERTVSLTSRRWPSRFSAAAGVNWRTASPSSTRRRRPPRFLARDEGRPKAEAEHASLASGEERLARTLQVLEGTRRRTVVVRCNSKWRWVPAQRRPSQLTHAPSWPRGHLCPVGHGGKDTSPAQPPLSSLCEVPARRSGGRRASCRSQPGTDRACSLRGSTPSTSGRGSSSTAIVATGRAPRSSPAVDARISLPVRARAAVVRPREVGPRDLSGRRWRGSAPAACRLLRSAVDPAGFEAARRERETRTPKRLSSWWRVHGRSAPVRALGPDAGRQTRRFVASPRERRR